MPRSGRPRRTPRGALSRVAPIAESWRKRSCPEARPVAPIDYTAQLTAPLPGLFGNDYTHPSPEQVDLHEAELKRHGKAYESHRYDGAGHGFGGRLKITNRR
jgi:dienelactone hydrolase